MDAIRVTVRRGEAVEAVHLVHVRATDGTGATQTAKESRPDPDGATGYDTIEVTVR